VKLSASFKLTRVTDRNDSIDTRFMEPTQLRQKLRKIRGNL